MIFIFFTILYLTTVNNHANFVESSINFFPKLTGRLKVHGGLSDYEKLMHNLKQYTFLFGQGLNYSYSGIDNIVLELRKFYYISADFTFFSFINQFGIFGYFLFSLTFCFYSMKNFIINKDRFHNMNLIILWLGILHYPIFPSKLIMLYISYSIFMVYFVQKEKEIEKYNCNYSSI